MTIIYGLLVLLVTMLVATITTLYDLPIYLITLEVYKIGLPQRTSQSM